VVQNEMIFELSNGGKMKLAHDVLLLIDSFVQRKTDMPEAGGTMLGRFIKDSKDIVIDQVTQPMEGDRFNRYTFKRLSSQHQQIIEVTWEASKGTCNYLGEWHTHPEPVPTPSGIDLKDWRRKLKSDVFSSRYLYFLIAGTEQIYMWEGDRRTLDIVKLKIVSQA
jgi:integrative and conjugative element protein (TIGR02256 family)